MFSLQKNFNKPTVQLSSEEFTRLVISDEVNDLIRAYRQRLPELQNPDLPATTKQEIARLKSSLPLIIYQATFDETESKGGVKAAWRKQSAARLNGLFMLDVDHVDTPKEMFEGWVRDHVAQHAELQGLLPVEQRSAFCDSLGILLVHVTPSGHGLRFVAKADVERGNLADNQHWLAQQLNVTVDEACKDASRCSFCPGFEDLLFIKQVELFGYENKAYDERWGETYRIAGGKRPVAAKTDSVAAKADNEGAKADSEVTAVVKAGTGEGYHGVPYVIICNKWFELVLGGQPTVGDRHGSLYRLACDLRYICDFNPVVLADILSSIEVGQEIITERGQAEIERIATDACNQRRNIYLPKRLQQVLAALDIKTTSDRQTTSSSQQGGEGEGTAPVVMDYEYWSQRLKPFLKDGDPLSEAVKTLPDHHKMGGILAAGCMFGTYLTRTWWHHFDGKTCRLSFLVYIPGNAASGKSFIVDLDRLIMEPLRMMDEKGRQAEEKYEEEVKKRSMSTKNARGEAPQRPAFDVRVIPSSISNKMMYRRSKNSVDPEVRDENGNLLHHHLYTMESELATALRAQQGSWAGKLDFELKSFHNEYAGVDYADEGSANGLAQVNWNQVVSGTWGAFWRKFGRGNVLDGMATRLCLFPMPDNAFTMIERRDVAIDKEREQLLRTIGLKLEEVKGLLDVPRLVDYCYEYEAKLTEEARVEQDRLLDYFRKRIPIIMIRYTLVRIVTRQLDAILRGEDIVVTDEDLEFARLIGDFCLFTQMFVFGDKVEKALELENCNFVPRKRSNKVRFAYAQLPMEGITREMLVAKGISNSLNAATKTLNGWQADGLVEFQGSSFRKLYEEIPL